MSEPTSIGEILSESVMPELAWKRSEVKALREALDSLFQENSDLRKENSRLRNFDGYRAVNIPDMPMSVEYLRERLTYREFEFLFEHATCLACLQGNAFDDSIDQYCLQAYVNLWSNGYVGKNHNIPNLYQVTAAEYYRERGTTKNDKR